uniref:Uncharacterized protein n=1 Tax=Arundo donax TaxID=35708 RepID=A0A0A9CII9_ARUDO
MMLDLYHTNEYSILK